MPRVSKHSKAYPRRSVAGEKRKMNVRSTSRQVTRDKLIPNDTIQKPFNPSDGRAERQRELDKFQSGLKPIRQSSMKGYVSRGPELVSNYHFEDGNTDWTHDSGWLFLEFGAGHYALVFVPQVADVDLQQEIAVENGATYEIRVRLLGSADEPLEVYFDDQLLGTIPPSGRVTFVRQGVAVGTVANIMVTQKVGGTVFIDEISVRKVLGVTAETPVTEPAPGDVDFRNNDPVSFRNEDLAEFR